MRELFASAFEHAQQDGRIASDADPQALARVMQAAADGLQVQRMLDSRSDRRWLIPSRGSRGSSGRFRATDATISAPRRRETPASLSPSPG